jgi:hypothetical protein
VDKGPVDSTKFDPNRTPFSSPAPQFTYIDIPLHGRMMVNGDTKEIVPIPGDPPLPAVPIRLPDALMDVPQPAVRTCGPPGEKIGQGCLCAMRGGCAIYNQFGRIGPKNLIIERYGRTDSVPCHLYYVGVTQSGRAAHGAALSLNGWRIITDRTTTDHETREGGSRINRKFKMEVDNLAPFYDHLKKPVEEKKKRGRPKKVQEVEN